ncbi:hypothetical protein Tco_0164700 [Tanacetum coccineum]
METVFRISNCTVDNQVKFATCTLMGIALTWWNSHARTVTNEVAYAMTWTDLKKKMTTKYCPIINQEDVSLKRLDKIERYVGGMPDLIYSSVVASKPKTMQEAIEMATELMDRRINTFAERQAENKRKFEDTPRNNQNQQPRKRQNITNKQRLMLPPPKETVDKNLLKEQNLYDSSVTQPYGSLANSEGLSPVKNKNKEMVEMSLEDRDTKVWLSPIEEKKESGRILSYNGDARIKGLGCVMQREKLFHMHHASKDPREEPYTHELERGAECSSLKDLEALSVWYQVYGVH